MNNPEDPPPSESGDDSSAAADESDIAAELVALLQSIGIPCGIVSADGDEAETLWLN
jgi:hypothetical protein